MATDLTQTYCDQFERELEAMKLLLQGIEPLLKGPTKALRIAMNTMMDSIEAPGNAIDDAMTLIADSITDSIPPVPEDVDELQDLALACDLIAEKFSTDELVATTQNALGAFQSSVNEIFSAIEDTLSDLLEYPVSKLINDINEILARFNLGEQIDKLDKYRDCANALCGGQLSSLIDEIDSILENLYVDENGFDWGRFGYAVADERPEGSMYFDNYSGNITSIGEQMRESKETGASGTAAVAEAITNLTKGLF